jgi:hypothetical protein
MRDGASAQRSAPCDRGKYRKGRPMTPPLSGAAGVGTVCRDRGSWAGTKTVCHTRSSDSGCAPGHSLRPAARSPTVRQPRRAASAYASCPRPRSRLEAAVSLVETAGGDPKARHGCSLSTGTMKSQLEGGSRSFPAPSRSVTSGPLVPTKRACVNWLPGQSAAPSSECRSTLIARMAASHPTRGRSEPPSCRRRLPSRGTAQSRRPAHPRAHWILPGTSARSRYRRTVLRLSPSMSQRQTDEGEAQQLNSWSPASTLVQSWAPAPPPTTAAAEPGRLRPSSSQPC